MSTSLSSQVIHHVHHCYFYSWQKSSTACQPSITADAAIRIVLITSAEGYTLPTRFDTSAGRNPWIDIQKVCEVQIIKQTLSLVHSSIGSFPRARDTDISVSASLVLPVTGCCMNGNFHPVRKYPRTVYFYKG